eukprot:CAMPEP_0113539436 /NCGR_PEP_ID=MMETSP0015_2-20120614/7916_1 /TAXON_ID=2838 /ORGANISM="Odontella" /LENGTH=423 /DNA_ID=CAMNT_0000439113 /DNA_START=15 /DNA_END=1286 /DNA_ORIENTATION=+ /assembly_acc=CAM_ASM_000160
MTTNKSTTTTTTTTTAAAAASALILLLSAAPPSASAAFFGGGGSASSSSSIIHGGGRRSAAAAVARGGTHLSMSAALIVQNKGGGHGELGFQLAKTLSSNPKITSITILQDDACDDAKEPFKSYSSDIPDVKIVKANLGDDSASAESIQSILGDDASYEYVWDNASKKPEGSGRAMCDLAKKWDTKLFAYVSSAGMYQTDDETTYPMSETTPVKESAGQAQFDSYAVSLGLPLVSFRPQYIYGPKSNKNDYVDWYLDRISRGLRLPVPGDGTQKVSLTNSEDVASLLSSVLNDEDAAVEQRYFNCGTDDLIEYDEVAYLCADAAGIDRDDVHVEHYDGDAYGKAKFPFRLTDFYVSPDTAKEKLGWEGPKHTLADDLGWYYEGYKARGGEERGVDLAKDWEIVSETDSADADLYAKYDSSISA